MTNVELTFFGELSVRVDGKRVVDFSTDKSRALLAYLALESHQPHSRSVLAGLLWPNFPERQARDNLRNTIHRLRKAVDQAAAGASDQILAVTRHDLQFRQSRATVDVLAFQARVDAVTSHEHDSLAGCSECLANLMAAADLYKGDLLRGLSLGDAPDFEEWLLLRREFLHLEALRALTNLAMVLEVQQQHAQAHVFATRLLAMDPFREESHRQVMRLLAQQGLADRALAQYESLRKLMREEFGVEPEEHTTNLVRQISGSTRESVRSRLVSLAPPFPPSQSDWADSPLVGHFFGRQAETDQLTTWMVDDRCQLITLLGMGGVGKSTLAAYIARSVSGQFDTVIWRSLLNAPPLKELLASVIHMLAAESLTALPESVDDMLALLLDSLRRQRCLLVLDNFETVLKARPAGHYRAGYEDYGQLLHHVGAYGHQSCLLLTSRERPLAIARLEHSTGRVQSLPLAGLDGVASQRLLVEQGLEVTPQVAALLTQRYSGNPLALHLVAQSIHDLFLGDVDAFLVDETPIFGDIRDVLEHQIDRLPPLERDIMGWLAVARQPMSPGALRQNLVGWSGAADLFDAMRGLQRRFLVEKAGDGFGLQDLVIEYLTDRLVEQISHEIENGQLTLLDRFALLHTQASEAIRQSQARLVLTPIAERLQATLGNAGVAEVLNRLLDRLHEAPPLNPGYAGGNLLNLMLHMGVDVTGCDFARLNIWQAHLQGARLPAVSFAGADFSRCTFTDTSNVITSVAFSPDGRFVAAGSADSEIRLWRTQDGMLAAALTGHERVVVSIAFSPDGRTLASGSVDNTVRLWDVAERESPDFGQTRAVLTDHEGSVYVVAFSADGQTLASGSRDLTVRLWDANELLAGSGGAARQVLRGHTGSVMALAFSHDGRTLASGGWDHTIRLWELQGAATAIPGDAVAVLEDHGDMVSSLAFHPGGRMLASGSNDNSVRLWDYARRTCLHVLRGHPNWVTSVAFDPAGRTLASGSVDQTIRLWNLFDPDMLADIRQPAVLRAHSDWVRSVAFSPDGRLLVSGGDDKSVRVWDVDARQLQRTYQGFKNRVLSIAFSPDGLTLASGSEDGAARLWPIGETDLAGAMLGSASGPLAAPVSSVAFHPGGEMLATCGARAPVQVWDVKARRLRFSLTGHDSRLNRVKFSPDGRFVAAGGDDCQVYLWSIRDRPVRKIGPVPRALRAHEQAIQSLAFSPDSRLLVSGDTDGTIRLWEVDTGRVHAILQTNRGWVNALAFSHDGALLASGGADGAIRLWEVASQTLVHEIRAHSAWIRSVAFSPDGRLLASGGNDFAVRLWHVPSGEMRAVLDGFTDMVWSVAFSPDGQTLASGCGDEMIKLWNPDSGECMKTWHLPGPYQGMNISGATGITDAQRAALRALGAVEGTFTTST